MEKIPALDLSDLCALCLSGAGGHPAAHIVVHQSEHDYTDRPLALRSFTLSAGILVPGSSFLSGPLAGYPERFVDVARFIGDGPAVRWEVNNRIVRIFAEVDVFGLRVCANHLRDALELWQSSPRQRVPWL